MRIWSDDSAAWCVMGASTLASDARRVKCRKRPEDDLDLAHSFTDPISWVTFNNCLMIMPSEASSTAPFHAVWSLVFGRGDITSNYILFILKVFSTILLILSWFFDKSKKYLNSEAFSNNLYKSVYNTKGL